VKCGGRSDWSGWVRSRRRRIRDLSMFLYSFYILFSDSYSISIQSIVTSSMQRIMITLHAGAFLKEDLDSSTRIRSQDSDKSRETPESVLCLADVGYSRQFNF
jgi:hypothetical protein